MSICEPLRALAMALLLGVPLAHCGLSGNCLRYSDCDDGLTCARGKCVPLPTDGGAEGAASADATPSAADVSVAQPASCDDAGGAACDDGSGGEGGAAQASTDATAE